MDDSKVNILIVDDRPEKLVALEAVLDDLHQNIILAHSGQDALRQLLSQEFAVVLLDVNMPGMDGFETAQFIRQRRNSAHVPIIFLTAMNDEMHVSRGYSLGAVDYILTPVVPEVLRSKVAVFVDLCRKSQQVKLQAESLRHRAMQLHRLTQASLAINSATSVERIVEITVETARAIVGTEQAVMIVAPSQRPTHVTSRASYSSKYTAWESARPQLGDQDVHGVVRETNKPLRMTQSELQAHTDLMDLGGSCGPPLRGLLAVPLVEREGRNMGLIFLSDKTSGEFGEEDQAVLTQLAQMASVAVENTMFAEERESNRVKDEFLNTLSHELRTPLSAIAGWVQLLKMESLQGTVARAVQVIDRNVGAQIKLIEELLDLSRIQTGKLALVRRPVELTAAVEDAVNALRPTMENKGISLSCQFDSHDCTVVGDPNRLQQVFWNLLSNASKFTPTGGQVHVQLNRAGDSWRVSVTDTGEGIEAEFLPHVFDRFRQADSSSSRHHGGLGIGLTIVRHIVEMHGGTVAANSAGKGAGSTFSITLPAAPVTVEGATPSNGAGSNGLPAPGASALKGIHVLVVDDEPDAREVVTAILQRYEADVTAAGSAVEALHLLRASRPHAVVSDLAMPGEDGFALLGRVRGLSEDQGGITPVIALTAYARPEDKAHAMAAGFNGFVSKPVDPDRLIRAVRMAVRKSEQSPPKTDLDMPAGKELGVES